MSDIKLPPLPAEFATLHHDDGFFTTKAREEHAGKVFRTIAYTAEQMHAYARAAIEADRAQRVPEGAYATAYRYCHRCGYKSETVVITKAAAPPVAQRCQNCDDTGDVHTIDGQWRGTCHCPAGQAINARQAQPAERKPLTEEMLDDMANRNFTLGNNLTPYQWRHFARAIERAHGIGD